jgi:hypothetical protein
MKTNQNTFFGIIAALIAVIFTIAAFAACPQPNDDNKKQDPKCECLVKIHDEDCGATCFGKGNAGCLCVDKTHDLDEGAKLVDERTNVAEADRNAVAGLVASFNGWLSVAKTVDTNCAKVIARGLVITIKSNATLQVEVIDRKTVDIDFSFIGNIEQNMFNAIIADIYSQYQSNARSARETVRLAKAPFDAKAFAKLVAAQVRSGRARA